MCIGGQVMEVLVITGGIGSGKSEVCRILARKGLNAQYNADAAKANGIYTELSGNIG